MKKMKSHNQRLSWYSDDLKVLTVLSFRIFKKLYIVFFLAFEFVCKLSHTFFSSKYPKICPISKAVNYGAFPTNLNRPSNWKWPSKLFYITASSKKEKRWILAAHEWRKWPIFHILLTFWPRCISNICINLFLFLFLF